MRIVNPTFGLAAAAGPTVALKPINWATDPIALMSNSKPNARELLEAKRSLPQRLYEVLPEDVIRCELLLSFCRGMIAPDPLRRFPSAEAAELLKEGAAAFHRQLIMGDLASEYGNEIRQWLEELKELDESADSGQASHTA